MTLHLSQPETPTAISAQHEQKWLAEHDLQFNSEFPNYYKKNARHLHFVWSVRPSVNWDSDFDFRRNLVFRGGPLPAVEMGAGGRFSAEGVRYTQLYSRNRGELVFKVAGDQFTSGERDVFGRPLGSVPVPVFVIRIDADKCPDGALIRIGYEGADYRNDLPSWKVVRDDGKNFVSCCI